MQTLIGRLDNKEELSDDESKTIAMLMERLASMSNDKREAVIRYILDAYCPHCGSETNERHCYCSCDD